MSDFLAAAAAMSESPLIRFLVVIAIILAAVRALSFYAAAAVARMVDEALADDELIAADWADPWHATPTFRDMCGDNPAAVDALAAAEAARFDPDAVDWSRP